MPRLRDRNQFVPHGFRFVWAATGWDAQKVLPHQSFDATVRALQSHVRGLPHQAAQSSMPTDYEALARMVDDYTARQLKREGYTTFIMEDAPNPQLRPQRTFQPLPQSGGVAAVGAIKKTSAGIKTYSDWIGDGGRPVAKEIAEQRAGVCASCPMNKKGDWKTWFTEKAAAAITAVIGMKSDLSLETSHDMELGLCEGCGCVTSAKVWVPLQHISKNTDEKVKEALHPECWILKELSNARGT